jgi:hypothetical protein
VAVGADENVVAPLSVHLQQIFEALRHCRAWESPNKGTEAPLRVRSVPEESRQRGRMASAEPFVQMYEEPWNFIKTLIRCREESKSKRRRIQY